MLYRRDVDMLQSRLKKPVMTARPKRPPALHLSPPLASASALGSYSTRSPTARPPATSPAASNDWASLASASSLKATSPAASPSNLTPLERPPSHVLSPSGLPVPSLHEQPPSAFSPNSSIASSLPNSIFSADDLALRRSVGKGSDATVRSSGRESGPSTPNDDPTLAFIFDSYKYSDPPAEGTSATFHPDPAITPYSPVSPAARPEPDVSAVQAVPSRVYKSREVSCAGAHAQDHVPPPVLPTRHRTPRLDKLRRPRLESLSGSNPSLPASSALPISHDSASRLPRAFSLPRTSSTSTSSGSSRRRRSVDYSTGISNRDFAEETVQIGKSEFEIVKPLATLLLQDDEHAMPASEFRTVPISHPNAIVRQALPTAAAISSASFTTPRPGRLAASASSHFSPPTPPSAEVGGRTGLANYRAREAKWLAALSTTAPSEVRSSKKIRQLVGAGIPSSLRGRVWAFLTQLAEPLPSGFYRVSSTRHAPSPRGAGSADL